MKYFVSLFLLLVNTWSLDRGFFQSMSISSIEGICEYDGNTWVATDIGVLKLNADSMKILNTLNGLEENYTSQVLCTQNGLYAISQSGRIAKWNQKFITEHTSFTANKSSIIKSNALAVGNYLIIPFAKVISFYNINTKQSELSVEKVANIRFENNNINGILLRSDSLIIYTDSLVYWTKLNFNNLMDTRDIKNNRVNLFDPAIWKRIPNSNINYLQKDTVKKDTINTKIQSIWLQNNQMWSSNKPGKWLKDSTYTFTDRNAKFNNQIINIPELNETKDTIISMYLAQDQSYWLTTKNAYLYHCNQNSCKQINVSNLPKINFFDLVLDREYNPYLRGAYSLSSSKWEDYLWKMDRYSGQWQQKKQLTYLPAFNEYVGHNLNNTLIMNDGKVYSGTWGFGLFKSNLNDTNQRDITYWASKFNKENPSCIGSYNDVDDFAAIPGLAKNGSDLWFNYLGPKYGVGKVDSTGQMTCFPALAQGNPDAIHIYGDTVAVSTQLGVDFYQATSNKLIPIKHYPSSSGEIVQFLFDSTGSFWTISNSQIAMSCSKRAPENLCAGQTVDSMISLMSYLNFADERFTSMGIDAAGNIWLGTLNDGVFMIQNSSKLNLKDKKQYTSKDGLGSNMVLQVEVSPLGEIWFGHPNGLSRYSTGIVANSSRVAEQIRPYPNPYRYDKHQEVSVTNIPNESSVHLLSPAGEILLNLSKDEIKGGKVTIRLAQDFPDLASGAYRILIKTPKETLSRTLAVIR